MKKIVCAFLLFVSTFSVNAQCFYMQMAVAASADTLISITSNAFFVITPTSQNNQYEWVVADFSNNIIHTDTNETSIFTFIIPTSDSIKICLTVTNILGEACQSCDTLYWDGPIFNWTILNNNTGTITTSMEAPNAHQLPLNKNVLDLFGRKINHAGLVPKGMVYIQNGKKYIRH